MLKLVPGRFYVHVSAWHIKLKTMMSKFVNSSRTNSRFCDCSTVVILLMWARLNAARLKKNGSRLSDFFTEYGTVARLKERTKYCMPAS